MRRRFPTLRLSNMLLLSAVALVLVAGSLWYSNRLVSRMAAKEERLVQFWAKTAEYIYTNSGQAGETEFLLNNVLLNTGEDRSMLYVPAILTDSSGTEPLMHNLSVAKGMTAKDSVEAIRQELDYMRQEADYEPIKVNLPTGGYQLVHFRETDELIQLRYFPYVTLIVLSVFVGIVFANYYIAQRSQMNKVWAGLAKETAHQLGTPISALMAWVEFLKADARDTAQSEVAGELEKDVNHLDRIAQRFSKIGSAPDLQVHSLSELIDKTVAYYQTRSSRKTNIRLVDDTGGSATALLSPTLFEWVLENLIKNALDAGATTISVYLFRRKDEYYIDVADNGSGMPPNIRSSVFDPGFTTKQRGWGLGLSLARRIVRSFHNGHIFIKWTEPGRGTAFRIQIGASD